MAGFIPAPGKVAPVLVGLEGATPLSSADGPIILAPGVGLFGRTDKATQKLKVDGVTAGPAETLCLATQTVAVGLLGTFTQPRASGSSVVSVVDVNLITAPTGTTANDHLAVRVRGRDGGSGTLPMTAAFQSLDFASPTKVAGTNGIAAGGIGGYLGPDTVRGVAKGFRVTSKKTIRSWTMGVEDTSAGSTINTATGPFIRNGVPKRFELLGPDLQPLAGTVYETTRAMVNGEKITQPFPVEVVLEPGITYYAAVMRTDNPPGGEGNTAGAPWACAALSASNPANPGFPPFLTADTANPTTDPATGWGTIILSSNLATLHPKGAGARWADAGFVNSAGIRQHTSTALGQVSVPEGATSAARYGIGSIGSNQEQMLGFLLNGSTGGFLAIGPLLVDVVQVGLGPTTPGTALNVRVSLA